MLKNEQDTVCWPSGGHLIGGIGKMSKEVRTVMLPHTVKMGRGERNVTFA